MKHRLVTCMGGEEEKLSEQYCDLSTKPAATESCQLPECASWQVGIWGAVSHPHCIKKTPALSVGSRIGISRLPFVVEKKDFQFMCVCVLVMKG